MPPGRESPPASEPGRDDQYGRGPIGGQMYVVLRGVLLRLRLTSLVGRYGNSVLVLGIFSFVNGCLSIAIMAGLALISGQPFIFPSLGPTAFLFFYTPLAPVASPRNAILGHLVGVLAGWGSLAVFGLLAAGPALSVGVTGTRVGAAALSLGLTAGLMVALKVPHPPAGATTLIISLGLLRTPVELGILMLGVALLTVQAVIINRLAGVPYPIWATKPSNQPPAP